MPNASVPDVEGFRLYVEHMIAADETDKLVSWIVKFVATLWKLLESLRGNTRSQRGTQPKSERTRTLKILGPSLLQPAANEDGGVSNIGPRAKKDKRKKGDNKTRNEHGRHVPPPQMEREELKIVVPADQRCCPHCDKPMTGHGWLDSKQTEQRIIAFFLRVFRREKLRCTRCQSATVIAPAPDQVRDKGSLGIDLVVDATVGHHGDGVPFERMERDAKEQGVTLPANTLAANVGALVDLLDPIVDHIFQRCVTSHVVGVDATRMPVIDRELPEGIHNASLWNMLGDEQWSYFGYTSSGHASKLEALLKGCTLEVLQCDGSATINVLHKHASDRAGCHSHARRGFVEAFRLGDTMALPAIILWAQLFAIEANSLALRETHEARLARRQVESRPIVKKLWAWIDKQRERTPPRSKLGQALGYATNQRKTLEVFLQDGRVSMTTNAIERELRTYVLDRKTWLFNGNELSAKRTAAALSIIRTCRLRKLNVRAYLRWVTRRLLAGEKDPSVLWPENFVPSG
jgi:transposase